MDNLPCEPFRLDYSRCIGKNQETKQLKKAASEGRLGVNIGNSLSNEQFNKLMNKYPQPGRKFHGIHPLQPEPLGLKKNRRNKTANV
uniref:Uncharacterized protein n=1 Tax=Acrobeloides nanus TaxID=290746 RepID=A0A914CYX0_9BILA